MDDMAYMPPPPMNGYGMGMGVSPPSNDSTIASMRWEGDPLVYNLYKILGGYEIKMDNDGNASLYRMNRNARPKMNDTGIESVVSIIRAYVNPVVSLSNIDDEEANELIRQVLYALVSHLAYNQQRFEIDKGDMGLIMAAVKGIIFTQVKRAVAGHESQNFHTQTIEQNWQQHQTMTNQNQGAFNFWPFKGRK